MDEEKEDIECNINNVTCDITFQSPVNKSVEKKDASWPLERRLAADVLAEIVEKFKRCSIQSDKQVDEIIDSEEHVDARKWLRNDSAEQVGVTNYSEELVVDGSDPKSNLSIATDTTNRISGTGTTNGIPTRKFIHCSSNKQSKLFSDPIPRSSPSR